MAIVVIQQMIIIFLLIVVGMIIYKLGHLSGDSSKNLSWIVVNVTNPITMLVAALDDKDKVGGSTLAFAFALFVLAYAFLGIVAYFLPVIMGVEKDLRYSYRYLTIFGNVGFIGVPFCSAVLGLGSVIYVTICCLIFNLLIYTVGMSSMRQIGQNQKAKREKEAGKTVSIEEKEDEGSNKSAPAKMGLTDIINVGTVMSVFTIIVYICDFQFPDLIHSTLSYVGRCTTFLSMMVLGVSVAQVSLKEIFSEKKLYFFVLIRQILVPIIFLFALKPFVQNQLMLNAIVILIAMPCANMPLMIAKQYDVDDVAISKGIIMTTVLSVITIPLVAMLM